MTVLIEALYGVDKILANKLVFPGIKNMREISSGKNVVKWF